LLVNRSGVTRFSEINYDVDIMNDMLYDIDAEVNNLEFTRDASSITPTRRGGP
jgi:hypothetical protein